MSSSLRMELPPLGEGQIARRSPTANNGGDGMRCLIRGTALLVTIPSRCAALGAWNAEGGLPHLRHACLPCVRDLLFCLLCWSSVVVPTAVVFFVDILHLTHQLSTFIKPRMPCLPGLIEGTRQIGGLPDALVLLRQSFPGEKIPVRQLTSKRSGMPK